MDSSVVKYLSFKANKVRWQPTQAEGITCSTILATGSGDEECNCVCMWEYDPGREPIEPGMMAEPQLLCTQAAKAGVTDLLFLDSDHLVASLSNGSVVLYNYWTKRQRIAVCQEWESLHKLDHSHMSTPCTCITITPSNTIVSGGEDGRLCIITPDRPRAVQSIDNADSSTVTALLSHMQFQVLSASSTGQLKLWDLRSHQQKPSRVIVLSGELVTSHCMDHHPNQPYLVIAGCDNGSICFWDLRQDQQPLKVIEAHASDVWEVNFHKQYPDNIFSCSQDGSLWHWDASCKLPGSELNASKSSSTTSLLRVMDGNNFQVQNYLPYNNMPVNSFDIEGRHLVSVTDGDAMFTFVNLPLK